MYSREAVLRRIYEAAGLAGLSDAEVGETTLRRLVWRVEGVEKLHWNLTAHLLADVRNYSLARGEKERWTASQINPYGAPARAEPVMKMDAKEGMALIFQAMGKKIKR